MSQSYPALREFLSHTDASYHADVPFDAARSALLAWYKSNRRRLPWRGDEPPYNGSTAGVNKAVAAARASASGAE